MPPPHAARRPWWLALAERPEAPWAVAVALLALRAAWLFLFSDLTLSEDEAHYWAWSLHPDWAYYTKPPGVAWLVRASTRAFGHTEAAVRLPAAVSIAVATLGAAAAARWTFPDRPALPAVAALLFACVPAFAVTSVLMTIDAPLIACWSWGVAFAARAVLTGRARDWAAFGACVGLGLLFKHTALLLPVGAACALLATRGHRPPAPRAALAIGAAIALLGLVPTLAWNAAHGWPTARHLLGHLGLPGGDVTPNAAPRSPRFVTEYLAILPPVIGAVLPLALFTLRRARATPGLRLHMAIAAPVLAFYLLVAFRTRVEGNWPIAAACSMTVAAAWCVLDGVSRRSLPVRTLWGLALLIGLLVTAAPAMLPFLSTRRVFGPSIPIARVSGMREHAAAARAHLDRLRDQTGRTPFVMADHYGRASLLAFYLPGTEVLSASAALGGRPSQFDLWPETNPRHPATAARLEGRPALLFGAPPERWAPAFDAVALIGPLPGEPDPATRTTSAGVGYKGFPTGAR